MNLHSMMLPILLLVAAGISQTSATKPPPEVKCSQTITKDVKELSKIPKIYENLPTCKGFSINVHQAKASSVFRIRGQDGMFPELWAKCKTTNGNQHDLLLFKRSIKGVQGLTDGFTCQNYKRVTCNELDDTNTITAIADPDTEYLFITMHKEIADFMSVGVACTDLTPAPTRAPTKAPGPAPEVKCSQTITKDVKELGTIPVIYNSLPVCNGFSVNVALAKASSVFRIRGQDGMFPELWAKCKTANGNQHDLLLYKRAIKGGQGLIDGFTCQNYKRVTCNELDDTNTITAIADPDTEYLFITLHKEIADFMSVGVACTDLTPAPTRAPTQPPKPVPQVTCGEIITQNVNQLGKISPIYERLPACGEFSVDVHQTKASSVFKIHVQENMFPELWVLSQCTSLNSNKHHLFLYKRVVRSGQGLVDGYQCGNYQQVTCNDISKVGSMIPIPNEKTEYLFITLHQTLDDFMSVGVGCLGNIPFPKFNVQNPVFPKIDPSSILPPIQPGFIGQAGPSGFGGNLPVPVGFGSTGQAGASSQAGATGQAGFGGPVGQAGGTGQAGFGGPVGQTGPINKPGKTGFGTIPGSAGPTGQAGASSQAGATGQAGFGPVGQAGASSQTGATGQAGFGPTGQAGASSQAGATGQVGFGSPIGQVGFGSPIGQAGFGSSASNGDSYGGIHAQSSGGSHANSHPVGHVGVPVGSFNSGHSTGQANSVSLAGSGNKNHVSVNLRGSSIAQATVAVNSPHGVQTGHFSNGGQNNNGGWRSRRRHRRY